jgi:DHA1 family tetracycline resistance protein-like MFS transporter
VDSELTNKTADEGVYVEQPSMVDGLPEESLTAPGLGSGGGPMGGRKAAAAFIFFTVALDMLAMGMIAPVLPKLIEGYVQGSAVRTADFLGWFGTVFALMQFFFSPILGSLSDKLGRRPIVLLSNIGTGLDYFVMALAPTLGWLFVGRVISGITASSIPTAMAYAADVTPKEKRAGAFGMLSAAFGIGFVMGPAIGGLLGNINPRLPFWAAGGLSLINGCYGIFVLPESLAKENRTSFRWSRANPVGSLTLLRRHKELLGMAGVLLLGYLAQQSLMNVYVLYTDYRYHWTTKTVGFSLAIIGIGSAVVGGLLVKRAIPKFGERATLLLGLISGVTGYALFGISQTGALFWLGIPLLNGMSLAWPTAQGVMSHHVTAGEQGQLQGAINGLRGLAGLVGPVMFTFVFARAIAPGLSVQLPGAPFYLAALMVLLSAVAAVQVTRKQAVT